MGTTIGEVNINLRMSLAQFKKDTQDGTAEASRATRQMAGEMGKHSQEAKASLALLGEEIGVHIPRHLRSVITNLPALGSALTAAFSAIAVVALAEVVIKVTEKVRDLAQEMGGFGKEAQAAYQKLLEGNKQALEFAEQLKQKYRELALIGLTGSAREAAQAQLDQENRAVALERLNAGLARQKQLEGELAAAEAGAAGVGGMMSGVLGVVAEHVVANYEGTSKLKKEIADLTAENQKLAQSLQTVNLKGQTDALTANADAAKRAEEAQKK